MDESSKLILFTIMGRFIKPKTDSIRGCLYKFLSIEASGGRILNTNQLTNIEQLININQQLFLLRIKLHFFNFRWEQKKFSINAFLKYMYHKNFREHEIFVNSR